MSGNYPSRPYTLVSRKRRNIDEPTVIKDYREVRNYAYVRGSGNAGNEVFFEQAGLRDDDSPFGRVEFEVAVNRSSENDDPLTLLTETDTALSENGPIKQYEFAIKDRQGTRYKYDWDLGWIITGEYGGERRTVRVVGIEAEVDSEGEVISPILEDIGDTR